MAGGFWGINPVAGRFIPVLGMGCGRVVFDAAGRLQGVKSLLGSGVSLRVVVCIGADGLRDLGYGEG